MCVVRSLWPGLLCAALHCLHVPALGKGFWGCVGNEVADDFGGRRVEVRG